MEMAILLTKLNKFFGKNRKEEDGIENEWVMHDDEVVEDENEE